MAEVARLAGIDNATAFRFLNMLVEIGYVDRVSDSRKFRLALKVLDLGFNAIARSDLRTRARPILRGLVGEINEAASVGVLDGADVFYVERMQAGLARLGVDIRIGSRVPAYSSAVGHAITGLAVPARSDRRSAIAAAQAVDRDDADRSRCAACAARAGQAARLRRFGSGNGFGALCHRRAPFSMPTEFRWPD